MGVVKKFAHPTLPLCQHPPIAFPRNATGEDASLAAEREERWSRECGKVEDIIFSPLISGNSDSLEDAILAYIRITNELSG